MIPEISRNTVFETLYLESALNIRAEMDNAVDMALLAAGKLLPKMADGKLRFMNYTGFGSKIINPASLRDLDMKMDQVVVALAMIVVELKDWHSEAFDTHSFFLEMNLKWLSDVEYRSRITLAIPAQLAIEGKFEHNISGEMIIINGEFKAQNYYTTMMALAALSQEIDNDKKTEDSKRDPKEEHKKGPKPPT